MALTWRGLPQPLLPPPLDEVVCFVGAADELGLVGAADELGLVGAADGLAADELGLVGAADGLSFVGAADELGFVGVADALGSVGPADGLDLVASLVSPFLVGLTSGTRLSFGGGDFSTSISSSVEYVGESCSSGSG